MIRQSGVGRRLIDRTLIDELLNRRLDPLHLLQEQTSWCSLYGIESGSLRRVRENLGLASDAWHAARAGFQLGIELPGPAQPSGDHENANACLRHVACDGEPSSSRLPDYHIAVSMGELFMGMRVTDAIDEVWCGRYEVAIAAVERVCDTYGRFPNPEAAAGAAFELAIEARAVALTWGAVS